MGVGEGGWLPAALPMLGQGIMLWGLLRRSLICYGCSLADHKEEERADNKRAEADDQRAGQ